jgi:ArsR family transcriptional regulator
MRHILQCFKITLLVIVAGLEYARSVLRSVRPDDPEGLRQFKAEFFKGLAHPLRIRILELLREGPMSVSQLHEAAGVPASSVSQQLAVLRARSILVTERRGTTVIYRVRDAELFELLDVARRLFNAHLTDAIDMLRLVDAESAVELAPPP